MKPEEDKGVPIDELLTHAEQQRGKFERWLRRGQDLANREIPAEPGELPIQPAAKPTILTQLQMRGGKKQ